MSVETLFDFRTNRPITSSSQDMSNYAEYAEVVPKVITQSRVVKDRAHVVSIEGPWGSGKSTLVNLVEGQLREKHDEISIAHFNPLDYQTEKDMAAG